MPDQEVAEALRILRRHGIAPKASETNFQKLRYLPNRNSEMRSIHIDLREVLAFEISSITGFLRIEFKSRKESMLVNISLSEFKKLMGVE